MPHVVRYSLNFGLIWGLVFTFSDLIFYFLPVSQDTGNLLKFAIILLCMFYFLKYYKNKVNGGFLSMLESFRIGVNTGFLAGLVTVFLNFIIVKFASHEFIDKLMHDLYSGEKLSVEKQEEAIDLMLQHPFTVLIFMSTSIAIIGFVSALTFGFLLKKEKTTFKNKVK